MSFEHDDEKEENEGSVSWEEMERSLREITGDGLAALPPEGMSWDEASSQVPLWAFKLFQTVLQQREELREEEGEDAVVSIDETWERWREGFLKLVLRGVHARCEGPQGKPSPFQTLHLTIKGGQELIRLTEALTIAAGALRKLGPLAGVMFGVGPVLDHQVGDMAQALANVTAVLCGPSGEELGLREVNPELIS